MSSWFAVVGGDNLRREQFSSAFINASIQHSKYDPINQCYCFTVYRSLYGSLNFYRPGLISNFQKWKKKISIFQSIFWIVRQKRKRWCLKFFHFWIVRPKKKEMMVFENFFIFNFFILNSKIKERNKWFEIFRLK